MQYIIQQKENETKSKDDEKNLDVNDTFFSSMCFMVKQFSSYHQHLARFKIFSIVSELELQHITHYNHLIDHKIHQIHGLYLIHQYNTNMTHLISTQSQVPVNSILHHLHITHTVNSIITSQKHHLTTVILMQYIRKVNNIIPSS